MADTHPVLNAEKEIDLTANPSEQKAVQAFALEPYKPDTGLTSKPVDLDETREITRGDLARGLLWLLTFTIGGVLIFIGLGRLDGTVLTQSIFPSLIALAGTALGFYFGSQTAKDNANGSRPSGSANTPTLSKSTPAKKIP